MAIHIPRREFIVALGGAAAWPLAAHAQQPAKVPRVGILSIAASETAGTLTAFREGIRDLGYVEGQTIALDFRLSKGITDSLPTLAAELVRIPVNVIVTDGTSATLAAFAATRTIPIVMGTTGGDPVALGLAKSLSRPGGNVTGTQFFVGLSEKRLQLLKQAFPGTERVTVLANPKEAIVISEMPNAEMAAARMGMRLLPLAASTPAELRALTPAALSGSDGLLGMPGGMFWNNRATIIDLASRTPRARHLPGAGIRR
jgi:putative ABC transport system substrate-binding protein